jgi:glycosyltransferase involved in cell wall biosynthesis
MKTKIAIYAEAPPGWGGSFQYATSILDAISALDRKRYEIRVWYRHPAWRSLIAEKNLGGTVFGGTLHDIIYRGMSRIFAHLNLRQAVPSLIRGWERWQPATHSIRRWGADVCINVQQTSLSLPKSTRQIAPIHDLMHLYESRFPEVAEHHEWLGRQWIFGNIAERCVRILVDSPTGARHVQEQFSVPTEHIAVLPFVAPNSLLSAVPTRPKTLIDVQEGEFVFYPAQFWMHKNHVGLVEALALLGDLPMSFVFTGTTDKNGYPALRDVVNRFNLEKKVHVLGYVDDSELSWLYRHACCMAMPTFLGPTNIPPLEAMSLDCPVAVSDVYGMREQLGDAALYFNPGDPNDIARVLRQLWNDAALRESLCEKGRQRISTWNTAHFEKALRDIVTAL